MNTPIFNIGQTAEAAQLIAEYHYSGRMPANIQVCATQHIPGGLFGDIGDAVAACIFSIPPTRWSVPVIELTRLVRADDWRGPLTPLIAWACKRVKGAGWDLAVSFADWTQTHHGGVYQAASWCYHEQRDRRMDGVFIDGAYHPGRTCNSLFGTRSPDRLAEMFPEREITPSYDEGKHCYWRALTKRGRRQAAELGLSANPYPKPTIAA